MTKKIGFCCKWIDNDTQLNGIKPKDDCKQYNTGTTTVAWLNRQSRAVAEQKLWDLMVQNIEATRKLVAKVGNLDHALRIVRLSSDILPVFTHNDYKYFWQRGDVVQYLSHNFATIGNIARAHGVRLSFHPGQFCCLASDRPDVVDASIAEFEYHVDMARYMGYGAEWHDHGFKINVHISGKQGSGGIRAALSRMSTEARNLITIENEENTFGLVQCLELSDILPITMDIHHNWVNTGEYISPDCDFVTRVIDSWRGVRPTMHYSVSREDILVDHCTNTLPEFNTLLQSGLNKQKLRAHSDYYWNNQVNQWALSFWDNFDIMAECKSKNLGSFALYEYSKTLV